MIRGQGRTRRDAVVNKTGFSLTSIAPRVFKYRTERSVLGVLYDEPSQAREQEYRREMPLSSTRRMFVVRRSGPA